MNTKHFTILTAILTFYIVAQAYQQYVLLLGPLSETSTQEEMLLAGQHPLNYVRHFFILASMILMVPGFILLCWQFYHKNKFLVTVAAVFFLFFCFYEISYRSVHIFQVIMVWGKEFQAAAADERAALLPRFQQFYHLINAIYFPLLFSLMASSVCLLAVTIKEKIHWPVSVALAASVLQNILRLTSYTPCNIDIFTGIWYFVMVVFVFGLLILWALKMRSI